MRFAAIALLLTSANATTSSKDMKNIFARMSAKDLEAMAKHFQEAADAKSMQTVVVKEDDLPDIPDIPGESVIVNKWDNLADAIDHFNADHDEHMAAFDHASHEALDQAKIEVSQKLDEAKAFIDGRLSPDSIDQVRKDVDNLYNHDGKEGLETTRDELKEFVGKFKVGYDAGYHKALENWMREKPILREKVQGLADAAEKALKDKEALENKMMDFPETEKFNKSLDFLRNTAAEFAHALDDHLEKQGEYMDDSLAEAFRDLEDFEHEIEDDITKEFAKKKTPNTISMIKMEKASKIEPEGSASYFGWGTMTLLVAAVAGSAYTYNKVQKKKSTNFADEDMHTNASENLMSAL